MTDVPNTQGELALDLLPFVEQLLGRAPIEGDLEPARSFLASQRILVTGAAGSVGTALTAWLAGVRPESLVLLDHHENSLFHLRQGLAAQGLLDACPMRFTLADVRDGRAIANVLQQHRPDVVFHLAAYKHVPLSEESPEACVSNNVLGAWRLANAAVESGVSRFVYPSTDKAVYPANIYGATKRVVELMLQALAAEHPDTSFTAVRLVNVLGAHGGVIETWARQIREGRELTITDPAMTRYWIMMDEALYLLVQAAFAGPTGGALILDIGEPISMGEIARRVWELFGPADGDLHIRQIGARPGERMDEYLASNEERAVASGIEHLLEVRGGAPERVDLARITALVSDLEALIDAGARADLLERLYAPVTASEPVS